MCESLEVILLEVKRMAGDYEIFATISIGPEEIVMGENPEAPRDKRYMCLLYHQRIV